MKTPNPKLQIPKKTQIPSSNIAESRRRLGFGAWDFFGVWCLVFWIWPADHGQPTTNNEQLGSWRADRKLESS